MKTINELVVSAAESSSFRDGSERLTGAVFASRVHPLTTLEEGDLIYRLCGRVEKKTKTLPFEVGKTYKTREGRDCRIVCVDIRNKSSKSWTIAGLVSFEDYDHLSTFTPEGYYLNSGQYHGYDLIPATTTEYEVVPFLGENN